MAKLRQFEQDLNTSSQRCQNLGTGDAPRPTASAQPASPFVTKAADVSRRLTEAIGAVDRQLSVISESSAQWEAAERLRVEYVQWLEARTGEVASASLNPVKLHGDAAELELAHLQVGLITSLLNNSTNIVRDTNVLLDKFYISCFYIRNVEFFKSKNFK